MSGGPGTMFELTRSAKGPVETVLYRFNHAGDGTTLVAQLIADADGALYGDNVERRQRVRDGLQAAPLPVNTSAHRNKRIFLSSMSLESP